jgi:hypothetical protein
MRLITNGVGEGEGRFGDRLGFRHERDGFRVHGLGSFILCLDRPPGEHQRPQQHDRDDGRPSDPFDPLIHGRAYAAEWG